jgi:hypothetical protein
LNTQIIPNIDSLSTLVWGVRGIGIKLINEVTKRQKEKAYLPTR